MLRWLIMILSFERSSFPFGDPPAATLQFIVTTAPSSCLWSSFSSFIRNSKGILLGFTRGQMENLILGPLPHCFGAGLAAPLCSLSSNSAPSAGLLSDDLRASSRRIHECFAGAQNHECYAQCQYFQLNSGTGVGIESVDFIPDRFLTFRHGTLQQL